MNSSEFIYILLIQNKLISWIKNNITYIHTYSGSQHNKMIKPAILDVYLQYTIINSWHTQFLVSICLMYLYI